MCVFHSSQFTFMTRNQAAQPPNIIVDTKSGGNSAPDLVSKSVVASSSNLPFLLCNFLALVFGLSRLFDCAGYVKYMLPKKLIDFPWLLQ